MADAPLILPRDPAVRMRQHVRAEMDRIKSDFFAVKPESFEAVMEKWGRFMELKRLETTLTKTIDGDHE